VFPAKREEDHGTVAAPSGFGGPDESFANDDDSNQPQLDEFSPDAEIKADFNDSDDDDENILDLDVGGPAPLAPLPAFVLPQVPGPLRLPSASANLSSMGPPEVPAATKAEDEPAWKSAGHLVAFRETSVAVADDYLKKQAFKLSTGRKLPSVGVTNYEEHRIFNQGREDAKKIDVKRRRLKDAEED